MYAWVFDGIKLVFIGRLGKFFWLLGAEKDFSFSWYVIRGISITFTFTVLKK